jgi:uncharacterized protein
METFSPVPGFAGGLLIGLGATLLLLVNGRIAGISGIIESALSASTSGRPWRIAFVTGLIIGPLLVTLMHGEAPTVSIETSLPMLAVAGLLVGFGTRLGGGCTSGHGICGIGRGSRRSIIATVIFIAVAMLTVFVLRQVIAR